MNVADMNDVIVVPIVPKERKPWMIQRWDPSLICDPMSIPDHHVDGLDPDWDFSNNVYHLVDPFKSKEIGFWETKYDGVAYIYHFGYLRRHPKIQMEYEWCWNAHDRPYAHLLEGNFFLTL